jgi:hypothetical protein
MQLLDDNENLKKSIKSIKDSSKKVEEGEREREREAPAEKKEKIDSKYEEGAESTV